MVRTEVDFDALAEYFSLGFIPAPATAIRSVRKLGSGEILRWTPAHGAHVDTYWDLPPASPMVQNGSQDVVAAVRDRLRDAVESHLVSDVPLGAFLSGGIDSSAVVGLMSELGAGPVKTFSIGFPDERYSELGRARIVAERFGTDHHELVVEPDSIGTLADIAGYFDEPFADTSALPTYHVSKLARGSVKVALSGDGGDELFVGYPLFRSLEVARHAQRLPTGARDGLESTLRWVGGHRGGQVGVWTKRVADTLAPPALAYRKKMAAPGLGAIAPMLSAELRHELDGRAPFRAIDAALERRPGRQSDHPLDRFLYAATRVTLPGDMLVKVDRMSMANSLEVRVPLLDSVFVDAVASIPVEKRFRGWRLKGLLKEAVADLLPPAILRQPKRGFNVPLNAWFRGDAAGYAHDTVRHGWAASHGLLDREAIERHLAQPAGGGTLSKAAWSLLMFELWCSRYMTAA
jgi:asparagine synthase (glutamine-hydrolysing)